MFGDDLKSSNLSDVSLSSSQTDSTNPSDPHPLTEGKTIHPPSDLSLSSDNSAPIPPAADDSPTAQSPPGDLMDIKQKALDQLEPLVSKLDQTPEEKFKTTMMMIQASDNQALIKDAYDAAQAIVDEKMRAQALLDVVNEINYFAQQEKNHS